MVFGKPMQSNQRPGLIMIVSALLVMLAMGYLLFDYERNNRVELARAQGIDLVRLLGGMPFNQLVPATGQKSFLEVPKRGQSNVDFAYGAVIDVDGRITSETTRSGKIIPLAKQIVMMHYGELDFASEPGQGTHFFIRLEKISSQIVDAVA